MEQLHTKMDTQINPLTAVAEPLFLLATQLQRMEVAPKLDKIYQTACDALTIFNQNANKIGYSKTIINNATYIISALIDDIILSSTWGHDSQWQQENLINTFQKNTSIDVSFFRLLNRAMEEPSDNIDLLEIAYIALSLGYQGDYRKENTSDKLADITDQLYNLIRQERGEIKGKLPEVQNHRQRSRFSIPLPPVWLTLIITGVALVAIFIPYQKKLDRYTSTVIQNIQKMTNSSN